MKTIANYLLICVLTLSSCGWLIDKDECRKVDCYNGGYCDSGYCYCTNCFTGNNCETESRNSFINTYNGFINAYSWGINNLAYSLHINKASDDVCYVNLIDNCENEFIGIMKSGNIDIPLQSYTFQSEQGTISGNLYLVGNYEIRGNLNFKKTSNGSTVSITYDGLIQ